MKSLLIITFCLISAGSSDEITGSIGGSVQIRCPYEAKYKKHEKYLCRGQCSVLGSRDIPVKSRSSKKDKRFSLTDNNQSRVFTITITDLRAEDAGTYWCGIERSGLDVYTEVWLQVIKGNPDEKLPPKASTTSRSVSTSVLPGSTPSTTTHTGSNTNQTSAASSPVTGKEVAPTEMKDKPSGSTLIITVVAVILVLLLIGLVIFVVLLQRKWKKGLPQKTSLPGSSNNNLAAPHMVTYEEIKDTPYSNIKTPLDTSDSSKCIYDNIDLPTNPSSSVLYAVAQKPHKITQDIYSTAQSPTGPSQSPSYDITYSQLSYHPTADAPRMIFKKDDICVYDNINMASI